MMGCHTPRAAVDKLVAGRPADFYLPEYDKVQAVIALSTPLSRRSRPSPATVAGIDFVSMESACRGAPVPGHDARAMGDLVGLLHPPERSGVPAVRGSAVNYLAVHPDTAAFEPGWAR